MRAPKPAGLHPALHARLVRNGGVLGLDHLVQATLEDAGAQQLLARFGSVKKLVHGRPVADRGGAAGSRLVESLH